MWRQLTARQPSDHALRMLPFSIVLLLCLVLVSCVTVQYTVQEPYYEIEYVTENVTQAYSRTEPAATGSLHEEMIRPYILWSNPQLKFAGRSYIWYYGYNLSDLPAHENRNIKIIFYNQRYYENVSVSVFDMARRGQLLAPPLISPSDNISAAVTERNWITTEGSIGTFNKWINLANYKLDFARFLGGTTDLFLNIENPSPLVINCRGAKDVAVLIYGPTDPQNCRFNVTFQWSETVTENVTTVSQITVPIQVEHQVMKLKPVVKTKQVPFWEGLLNQTR
jgi:hypothetical protein